MRKLVLPLMASLFTCSAAFAFWPEAAESSVEIGVGYRKDKFDWTTKAESTVIVDGVTTGVETKSKLKWKDLQIWQIEGRFKYVTCDNLYFRGYADYGWITHGKVTDKDFLNLSVGSVSDFSGEGVEIFSSRADSNKGHVYDASIGLGYQFRMCDDSLALAPVFGYSWEGQHLELKNGHLSVPFSTSFEGLHSHYNARWNGWWLGIDLDYQFACDWSLFASYEYHWAEYHASGHWNLREDILGNFHHHAKRAYGNVFNIGVKWDFCECWTLGVTGKFQWWNARHGKDRTKVFEDANGDIREACFVKIPLENVKWDSASVTFDVGMVF